MKPAHSAHRVSEQGSKGTGRVVAHMKIPARIDCSRKPMEMAMPMAMTLALAEYWTARVHA